MKLLLLGKTGQVGWELQRSLAPLGELVALASASSDFAGDLRHPEQVAQTVLTLRPDVIVNAAAHTAVDKAESEPELARTLNATAPGAIAQAAQEVGALMVHYSTDYVFDGSGERPWQEDDATGPLSVYGRTKLEGEQLVQAAGADHAIVRTAWLFGPGGRNFVDTMRRLGAERDELQVVADQIGCPTYTGHLAEALLTIAEHRLTGIHHAAGGGACSWFDLALATFEATGTRVRVTPVTTEAFPRPAARPAWSVLGSERPDAVRLPDWREGLRAHLTTTATEVPA
jgi:dTDP-4-dehydrorhamnose reductase